MINTLIFPYDYILITILIIIVIFSFWRGFIQSVLGLLTWIGSILITIYSYEKLSDFLTKQLLNINFLSQYEYLTNILSITISIPVIFIIVLFILKRIRKILSSDLDKQILGVIFDKFFGMLYGIIFSYLILTAMIILLEKFKFNNFNVWLNQNSIIILQTDNFNRKYIYLINNEDNITN
tara:strand:- start:13 stop:552 length:540 start_codon:yes stop_codon:yes gene_type:complete